ncbi:FERM domain-containing protein 8 isoform X1 [Latimeria chalumnae]|uniref:FERM domain-containing protein 8 isoform X1 n=1 Tax=Latimeria chalumnae TaxID=7897 RepID=UPI0006D8FFBB|nr:PREDICTED: FERM domain-containing protein 8 [Latimeria chalumnae]|eukprot:XP_005988973.2 PREDICTED: FERM domain-containing protein 8 [Latimeria chalumnae]
MEPSELGLPLESSDNSQRGSVSSVGARSLDVLIYFVNDTALQLTVDNVASITALELSRIVREALRFPEEAQEVFSLWLISPLLELQLKPKHQPYKLCRQWQDLLCRFTDCSEDSLIFDEPSLQFRRNVFFPKKREIQMKEESVLRLLYEEAKFNILTGRYPCDLEDCEKLGALSCRVELGPYDQEQHNPAALRKKLDSFLPVHLCKKGGHGSFLLALRSRSTRQHPQEQGLLEAYKMVTDDGASVESEALKKHFQEYLLKCHKLPYYGCAFFSGEIDKPPQGILQRGGRKPVMVAVSLEGVYIIDTKEKHVLLGLRFSELSWDYTYPEEEEESHILWLEFDGDEEGTPVNKLLKVYSKQAQLMSGLIEYYVELRSIETAAQENSSAEPSPKPPVKLVEKRSKLRRQNSVVCNRIQHLSTIDYVDDGKEIKRVKPKRAASFFTRQVSHVRATYTAVQPTESLEQG